MDASSLRLLRIFRAIRNRFAHDYPEDDELKAAYLNQAIEAVQILRALLSRIEPLVASAAQQRP